MHSPTRLGLGLAALGRPAYINLGHDSDLGADKSVTALEERAAQMLDAAYAAGIRYFDAARSYGRAEEFLGGWLRQRGLRSEVRVGSKWGYTYVADWRTDADTHEIKSHDLTTLTRQWPETLAALGGAPDLYLIHSATLDTGVLKDKAVLAELSELAEGGVKVGLSTSGPRQADTIRQALAAQRSGLCPFSAVQATWNLLDPSAGAALSEAHAQGWTVVVKEGVANGKLTARGLSGGGDVPAPLAAQASSFGVTPDAVALAAVLAQPWADLVLSGASTPAQLAQNVGALSVQPDLAALGRLAQSPQEYWAARGELAWT